MSPSMASGGDWYMRRTRSRQGVSLTRPMLFHHWEQRLPVPYTWLRQLECLLPAPARRKPGEVGRRSPAQVGDRSGMIPRHAPRLLYQLVRYLTDLALVSTQSDA